MQVGKMLKGLRMDKYMKRQFIFCPYTKEGIPVPQYDMQLTNFPIGNGMIE
jgi:hypothetical protein